MSTAAAHQSALRLLLIHEGACLIPVDSRIGKAFAELEQIGLVTIAPSGWLHNTVNVYAKDFKPATTQDE